MGKSEDIHRKILTSFPERKRRHQQHVAFFAHEKNSLGKTLRDKKDELDRETKQVEDHAIADLNELQEAYEDATSFVESEFVDLQRHNQSRHDDLDVHFEKLEQKEHEAYRHAMDALAELQQKAKENYDRLIKKINKRIDESMQVHQDFIAEKEQDRKDKTETYSRMNADQANKLVWAIESSRTSLEKLEQKLADNKKKTLTDFNQTVMDSLDELRRTKRTLNKAFKAMVDDYGSIQKHIQKESKKRQQPHTEYNQSRIHRYSQQIRAIQTDTDAFEKHIRKLWADAKKTIREEISAADGNHDEKRLERTMLINEIIDKKAKALIDNRRDASNLHVFKYQHEIKRIKMDSFRRAEEIRVAYQSPIELLQNAINLLSNYHFYIGENFDAMDNRLSDFIQYHNTYLTRKNTHRLEASKEINEYGNQFIADMNDSIATLTDQLKAMDSLSKDMITIESVTRIKIADVKKQMENKHVRGDYEKTKAKLDQYRDLIDLQHTHNLKTLNLKQAYREAFLLIEHSALELHKKEASLDVYAKHAKTLSEREHDIQSKVYDLQKRLMTIRLDHDRKLADMQRKQLLEHADYDDARNQYLLAKAYETIHEDKTDALADLKKHIRAYRHRQADMHLSNDRSFEAIRGMLEDGCDISAFIKTIREERHTMQTMLIEDLVEAIKPIHESITDRAARIHDALLLFKSHLRMNKQDIKSLLARAHSHPLDETIIHDLSDYSYQFLRRQNAVLKTINGIEPIMEVKTVQSIRDSFTDFERRVIILASTCERQLKKTSKERKFKDRATAHFGKMIDIIRRHGERVSSELLGAIKHSIRDDVLHISKRIERMEQKSHKIDKVLSDMMDAVSDDRQQHQRVLKKIRKRHRRINERIEKRLKDTEIIIRQESLSVGKRLKKTLKATDRLMKQATKQRNREIAAIESAHRHIRRFFSTTEKRMEVYMKRLTTILAKERKKEKAYVDAYVKRKKNELADRMAMLDDRTHSLEHDKNAYFLNREKEIIRIHERNRHELNETFRQIENTKYLSRPAYLKKIDAIKDHQSVARDDIHRHLVDAQQEFLETHRQADQRISQDKDHIQGKLDGLTDQLLGQMTSDDPFTHLVDLHGTLTENIVNMQHIMQQKTMDTKDKLHVNEQKSDEKQSKFLNK